MLWLRAFLLLALCLLGGQSASPWTRGAVTGTTTWTTLKIGAGGLISGIDIASDGTKVIRTDTYGGYRWNGSAWSQIVTIQSMPSAQVGLEKDAGVCEIRIAPSSTTRFYMLYNGNAFRSDNSGATWTLLSNYTTATCDANGGPKVYGPYIAVDPQNADVVYMSTPSSGLRVSNDAGATWATVSGIANASSSGGHLIRFDPSSSVSGGKKQGIYATSYGTGVYHSTDGGQTWTLTTGTQITHVRMVVASDGVVYLVANDATDNLYIYTGTGTWATKSVGGLGNPAQSVAVDPADANKITVVNQAGALSYSSDHAANWTGFQNSPVGITRTATDIPWLAWTNENYMTSLEIFYDPSQSNKLYLSEGVGVWTTSPGSGVGTLVAWTSQSAGIEQLVSNKLLKVPSGALIYGAWDRPIFYTTTPTAYPSTVAGCASPQTNALVAGWDADYASSSTSTLVALCNFAVDTSGKSTDGGQTWTAFGTLPSGVPGTYRGGSIAASSATNYCMIPANNNLFVYCTTNSGGSWTAATISGPKVTGAEGWSNSYVYNRKIICADRVTANKFYAYYNGTSNSNGAGTNADGAIAGIYVSTDSGANFTKAFSGRPDGNNNSGYSIDYYNFKLRCVPGNAGHLLMAAGQVGGSTSGGFWRSTDAGATLTALPNVAEVYAFGFGKICPGGTYPAIFIGGNVSGTWGIYRSCDGDQATPTWTALGDGFPLGNFSEIRTVEGDPDTYGTVYVGTIGAGVLYGTLN